MKLTKDFQNLNYLSQGEHSLEEVLRLAGLEEEKPENDDGFCSVCGSELEVGEDESFDEDGLVVLPYLYCPRCKEKI